MPIARICAVVYCSSAGVFVFRRLCGGSGMVSLIGALAWLLSASAGWVERMINQRDS